MIWLLAAAVYLWFGVRYGIRMKDKKQAYCVTDWIVLLLLWWLFAFCTWMNRR